MGYQQFDETSSSDLAARLLQHGNSFRTSAGLPLPTNAVVIEIARNLRQLILPELWLDPSAEAVERAACQCLDWSRRQLIEQTAIALRHAQSVELRIHNADADSVEESAADLVDRFLAVLPQLQALLQDDVQAAFDRDPAARTHDEIVVCYPGIQAVLVYRLAHALLTLGVPYLPRILTEWAHSETGIDIHPGARIGPSFFIDHGTGVVIGETCVIGSSVTLYQGVTLGAWSFPRDEDGQLIRGAQRHPTLEDGVTVYSNATILGGTTVVGAGSQIGSSVTLSRSVPANTIVTIEKPSLQFREAG